MWVKEKGVVSWRSPQDLSCGLTIGVMQKAALIGPSTLCPAWPLPLCHAVYAGETLSSSKPQVSLSPVRSDLAAPRIELWSSLH